MYIYIYIGREEKSKHYEMLIPPVDLLTLINDNRVVRKKYLSAQFMLAQITVICNYRAHLIPLSVRSELTLNLLKETQTRENVRNMLKAIVFSKFYAFCVDNIHTYILD